MIGVYTLVLAAALPGAAWLRRRVGDRALGAAGLVVFALAGALSAHPGLAGAACSPSASCRRLGAAAALVAGFALLRGDRLWTAAAVFGDRGRAGARRRADAGLRLARHLPLPGPGRTRGGGRGPLRARHGPGAAGPAAAPRSAAPGAFGRTGAYVALAALSAALTGVLFLLVLLLVSGWSLEPLAAAAAVSVLPLAAFAGARVRGDAALRASAGCALVGAGVLALAALPGSSWVWIVAPQILAGLGMGMALPALAGPLLPERTPGQAAALLSVRHAGITLALLLLAPIAAAQLDQAVVDVRERGAALILDAKLSPIDKLELAGPLVADLDPADPRDALRASLDAQAGRFAGDREQASEYARLTGAPTTPCSRASTARSGSRS